MDRTISILDALTTKIKQQVLAATILRPARAWYLHELARHLDANPSTIQHELRLFASAGLLTRRIDGNRVYYQANQASPAFPSLHDLLIRTAGIADVIRQALQSLAQKIGVAFIYGSVAAGTEQAASDIDLMIVGEVTFADVTVALRATDRQLGRDVNPLVYSTREFRKKIETGAHFLSAILKTKLIFIYGTAGDLERLTRGQASSSAQDNAGRDKPTARSRQA